VLVSGVMAFTAAQQAIGALNFMPQLENYNPQKSILADPAGCLAGGYTTQSLKATYMRQLRYPSHLSPAILIFRPARTLK
jgi:hypothetical protein